MLEEKVIDFNGERVRVELDGETCWFKEGILKGKDYVIQVFAPTGDGDFDAGDRMFLLDYQGKRLRIYREEILQTEPLQIPQRMLELQGLTKEGIDILAEELIQKEKQDAALESIEDNGYLGLYTCFCGNTPLNFTDQEANRNPALKRHFRHKSLVEF